MDTAVDLELVLAGYIIGTVFFYSINGILYCELLFKAKLSDLLAVEYKRNSDPHPLFIQVMQMETGKFCTDFYSSY